MFYFILYLFLGVLLWSIALPYFSIAPWVPTKKEDLQRVSALSELKPGQTFIELGCGDGRVCRYIAKMNPEAKIIGVEISIALYLWAKIFGFFCGLKNMEIRLGNALRQDLSEVDVVYVFGVISSINKKLKEKFEKELRLGSKIISYVFSMKDWKGKRLRDVCDEKSVNINIYYK